jgi:hypothetical protein
VQSQTRAKSVHSRRVLISVVFSFSFALVTFDADQTLKKTTGTFKRKLERIKRAFGEDSSLSSCDGMGILFCCAASDYPKGDERTRPDWIEQECDIFEYNEEVECYVVRDV